MPKFSNLNNFVMGKDILLKVSTYLKRTNLCNSGLFCFIIAKEFVSQTPFFENGPF